MTGAPAARRAALGAAAAADAATRRDAAVRGGCLDAVHAARSAAHVAAQLQRDAASERAARATSSRAAAAASDVSSAAALAPLLSARMGAPSVLAARNAGALLRGVAPLLVQSTVRVVEQGSGRRPELCAHACRRRAART